MRDQPKRQKCGCPIGNACNHGFPLADPSPSVETPPPCENCGNEERTGAGYLTCECPDQAFVERPRITPAPSPVLDPVALQALVANLKARVDPSRTGTYYVGFAKGIEQATDALDALLRSALGTQEPLP